MPTNQSSAAENIWTRTPARGVILSHQGRVAFVVVMGSLSASSTPNKWQCHPTNFTMPNRIAASATSPPAKPNSLTRAVSRFSLHLGVPGRRPLATLELRPHLATLQEEAGARLPFPRPAPHARDPSYSRPACTPR